MPVEHVDEILGGQIARRPGRVRTATRPAGRRIEAGNAVLEAGKDVGQRGAARVVEVVGEAVERNPCLGQRFGERVDLAGHADADRVADADLVRTQLDQPQADIDHA